MNISIKEQFILLWRKYFGETELPITFYYTESDGGAERADKPKGWNCLICELAKVRNGKSLVFNSDELGCAGAKRYLGYTEKVRPGFEYFLSCGNDKIEGERYKRTPEIVMEMMKNQKTLPVSGKNIVFKRWDCLTDADEPEVVIFFATPDVLSGLFTLANFDQAGTDNTFAPFGAGCGTIVHYPYLESLSENPRAVIGMFDPSARPCVKENELSFAIPMKRFIKLMGYMEESFLITETWSVIKKRIDE